MPAELSQAAHLDVWSISKAFSAFVALDDISFSVAQGEMVCLLGPSGCGKTTALRIVAGLESQDSGRISINGNDVSLLPVSKRKVGIVFQSYALFPNLTAAQNIAYGLHCAGVRRSQARARSAELLALVGLPDVGGKFPAQLSGGQQQRVALARAMALSPDILLLDEPLSALDAQVRIHLRSEIKRLQQELGVTTIMVTHDQEEGLTMADRIILMRDGKIVQDAPPGEIYDRPATPFAASFLGSMNFLPAWAVDARCVRLGEAVLSVRQSPANGCGCDCSLAIRPEDVEVLPPVATPGGTAWNTIPARVVSVEFRGPLYRLSLRVADASGEGQERPLLADVSARRAGTLNLERNAAVQVHLPPERLHVFAA